MLNIFWTSIDTGNNEKTEFHSYISDNNEQDACGSHSHMLHLLKKVLESGRFVYDMSTVWQDTDGCTEQ